MTNRDGVTITYIDAMLRGVDAGTPRQAKEGIFSGCVGTLDDIKYQGETLDTLTLEERILKYFCGREIGYSTWQEFRVYFQNTWDANFSVLRQNLENVQEFTVIDAKETVTEDVTDTANGSASATGKNKTSDTPNQYLDNPESYNGLTGYSETESTTTADNTNTRSRKLETDKGGNSFERWIEISEKNRNMIYEFIARFERLFKTTFLF